MNIFIVSVVFIAYHVFGQLYTFWYLSTTPMSIKVSLLFKDYAINSETSRKLPRRVVENVNISTLKNDSILCCVLSTTRDVLLEIVIVLLNGLFQKT